MTAFPLRPYQLEIRHAVEGAWQAGMQRPAVVAATGLGKTVCIADIADRWVKRHAMSARQRVLIIAHRKELLDAAAAKVRSTAPGVRVGIVKAGRDNVTADIVIASKQTLETPARRKRIVHVGLVIVDEAHHAAARTYREVMEHYGCFSEGGARAVGFTATMDRSDDLALGDIWQDVVYIKGIESGIRESWLAPPRGKWIYVPDLDLAAVKKKAGGDYADGALGTAIEGSLAPAKVAQAYREHSADRQGILFAPTVHCAQVYAEALTAEGFKTVYVDGTTPENLREQRFEAIIKGDAQILANCGVATEGTDLPMVSTIVVGRPTKSDVLRTQMIGRGLRTHPGKSDCLVLFVAGKRPGSLQTRVNLAGGASLEVEDDPAVEMQFTGEELELLAPRDQAESGALDMEFVDGQLVTVEVDLFAGSKSAWCRTQAGTWFLPAGERLIVIKPAPSGLWDVVWCHRYNSPSGFIAADVADIGYAMAFAEANLTGSEKRQNIKGASWRVKAPNRLQLSQAARYGIIVPDDMMAGELAHQIDIAAGTMRIDPYVMGRQ